MTVSRKAVVDLRATWAAAGAGCVPCGDGGDDAAAGVALVPLGNRSRPPLCYDTSSVCVFCAQFFDGPLAQQAYRPVTDESGMGMLAGASEAVDLFDPVVHIDSKQK